MGKLKDRRALLMPILLSAVIAISVASIVTTSLAGGGGPQVAGYTIAGRTVDVEVHNPTRAPINVLVMAEADVGGARETRYSFAQGVPAGQTVTMTLYFSSGVLSITEGPDPIPQ